MTSFYRGSAPKNAAHGSSTSSTESEGASLSVQRQSADSPVSDNGRIDEVDWDADWPLPVYVKEKWMETYCPCEKSPDYHFKKPEEGECRKIAARTAHLWQCSKEQFYPPVKNSKGVDNNWWGLGEDFIAWLRTPKGNAAFEAFNKKEDARIKAIVDKFDSRRWDPLEMVEKLEREARWARMSEEKFKRTEPEWVAYMEIGHAQYKIHGDYNKIVAGGIKSKEDYNKADKLYKELGQHIDKHGHIMSYQLEKLHKLPKEKSVDVPKEGRRAARRRKNASESSTSTVSRQEARASMVADVQSYMLLPRNDE